MSNIFDMNNIYEKRLNALMQGLEEHEAAIITSEINIHYFTGFPSSEGALFVTAEYAALLVDFRYIEAAQLTVTHCDVLLCDSKIQKISELVNHHSVKKVCFEINNINVQTYNAYKKAMPEILFDETMKLANKIRQLRIIKDEYELECLRTAQKISEKSYLEVLNYLKPGVRERELALELEYLMRKNGAMRTAFDLITIAGENTSRPHGVPGEYRVKEGDFVTFDIGAVYGGYHSDMTRTVAIGFISDEKRKIYETVKKAQSTALGVIKSGVAANEADSAARNVIAQEGYAKNFGHATGHGVGLEIHEFPVLSAKSEEILKSGMIVTVEPGIYLPKKFGVRIEDTVCVLDNGFENFAGIGKDLIII